MKRRPMLTALWAKPPHGRQRGRGLLVQAIRVLAVVVLAVGIVLSFNRLPNDDEVISYVLTHRHDIEKLVELFRNEEWPRKSSPRWDDLPEVQTLKHQAGVHRLVETNAVWLENPYSPTTAEKLTEIAVRTGKGITSCSGVSAPLE